MNVENEKDLVHAGRECVIRRERGRDRKNLKEWRLT